MIVNKHLADKKIAIRDDGGYSSISGTGIPKKPAYSDIIVNTPSGEQIQPVNPSPQNVNYSDLMKTDAATSKVDSTTGEQKTDIGAVSNNSTPAPVLPTYEEYINGLKSTAETTRERELIDARSAYEQNRATYGRKAQELSRLGLTGSGYSQYIDSRAYAGMRDDLKAADAKYSDAIRNIDGMYASYLQQKESEKNAMYADLFKNIGSFTASDISNFGSQYGLSEEQIKALTDKRQNISYQELINGGYDKTTLDTALSSGDITQTHYDELLKDLQNPSGTITSESFINSDGSLIPRDEAQATIDQLKDNGVNEEIINSAQNTFDAIYNIKTNNVEFRKDGGFLSSTTPGKKGNNFSVKAGKKTYYVQYSGEEVSSDIKNAALALTDGTVFMYQGKVYMKLDGEVYGVEKRSNSYSDSWKELKKHLGG